MYGSLMLLRGAHKLLVYNGGVPEIHNEMPIDVLFCGVAGNGVRVCHHGD